MTAALEFLGRMTDQFFEMQMARAARKIQCTAAILPAPSMMHEDLFLPVRSGREFIR